MRQNQIEDLVRLPFYNINLDNVANAKNLEEFWEASVGKTLYSKFVEKTFSSRYGTYNFF